MYCTPCARLMKSITPNTSVSPAAIRNRMIPNCSPLRVWTRRRVADISHSALPRLIPPRRGGVGVGYLSRLRERSSRRSRPGEGAPPEAASRLAPPRSAFGRVGPPLRGGRSSAVALAPRLAVLRIHVAVVLEDVLDDLGLELAVGALRDLHQVEVLDRIAVGVELERAAR